MALDTNAAMQNARCIDRCIPDGMKLSVIIYQLATIAGIDPTDTNALIDAAKCIDRCVPPGSKLSIAINLLNQVVENSAADCEALSGDGDPTGVTTPEFSGQLYHDTTNDVYYRSTGTTSANWTAIGGS